MGRRRAVAQAATGLLLALLAGLAPAGCGSQVPVSPSACRPTAASPVSGQLAALPADPAESSIRGLVGTGVTARAGRPYEVRWVVSSEKAGDRLRLAALREGTRELYQRTLAAGAGGGQYTYFPSALTFPAAGCWDVSLTTGTAQGSVVIRVDG